MPRKKFKHPPAVRKYWREKQKKYRARVKRRKAKK